MQSDQKIGLCLLIGLLGFAAALGFGRRERPSQSTHSAERLELASADNLAPVSEIAAVEEVRAPDSPETIELAPPSRARQDPSESAEPAEFDLNLNKAPPTDLAPVTTGVSHEELIGEPIAGEQPRTEAAVAPAESVARHPPFVPYVVQPGDTLSGIAVRHLGDGNRYLDVYEANRDSLAHPDALQVGQTIRLPAMNGRPIQMSAGELQFPR